MRASITYHGGKSCWIGHYRFKLGQPLTVNDPQTIRYCQGTAGFSVSVDEEDPPKRAVVREVVKTTDEPTPKKKLIKRP